MRVKKQFTIAAAIAAAVVVTAAGCAQDEGAGSSSDDLSVGYLVNFGSHEWYQNVLKGAEDTANEEGIDFKSADANVDLNKQITQAEDMLTQGVDVLAMSPVDPDGLSSVMTSAEEKSVPVITEANPVPGAQTVVGIKNFDAAQQLGEWAGEYITNELQTPAKILIVGLPTQVDTRDRVDGFKEGLKISGADYEIVQEIDGGGLKDKALDVSTDAITAHRDINMIFGINDDSALGGTQAYQQAGLDMSKLTTLGFGVEGRAGKGALLEGGPYKAGLAMFPEYVGRRMIQQAMATAAGEDLPDTTVTPATVVTPENLEEYYTQNGDDWEINFDAVEKLLEEQS